jgi:hypothetical protein
MANDGLTTAVLGLPRIGRSRELKAALESYCGLKTRSWDEVEPALEHLASAVKRRRLATPTDPIR